MGFKKNKKSDITETVVKNDRGEEVHVLDGPDGTVEVERVHMKDFLPTGEEWCPHCHVQCDHYDEDEYFKCPECGWTITDWEIEEWGGHRQRLLLMKTTSEPTSKMPSLMTIDIY